MSPLTPPATLLCKLGSVAVHVDEMLSVDGHEFDRHALLSALRDSEVVAWLEEMGKLAMLPVKRLTPAAERAIADIQVLKGKTQRGVKSR